MRRGQAVASCGHRALGQTLAVITRPQAQHQLHHHVPRLACHASISSPSSPAALFDVTALFDTSHVVMASAWLAARHIWGQDAIPGAPSLYARAAVRILPALATHAEAVVLVRLLADEGVIGARSTSGREGPVVGRPQNTRNTRPLLVLEICEHWDEVLDSCLLRWSLAENTTKANMLAQASSAYDMSQQLLMDASTSTQPCITTGGRTSTPGKHDISSSGWVESGEATGSAPSAPAVALQAEQQALQLLSDIQPQRTAIEAVRGCQRRVFIASPFPARFSQAVMSRLGVSEEGYEVLESDDLGDAARRVMERQQQEEEEGGAGSGTVHVITANVARLEQLIREWDEPAAARQAVRVSAAPAQSTVAGGDGGMASACSSSGSSSSGMRQQQQQPQQQAAAGGLSSGVLVPHLAEWSCSQSNMHHIKAKALSIPRASLLSDHQLAELLGVSGVRAFMDGIAW